MTKSTWIFSISLDLNFRPQTQGINNDIVKHYHTSIDKRSRGNNKDGVYPLQEASFSLQHNTFMVKVQHKLYTSSSVC